jgi:flavin reductase (DIM6/NTAB) family NADH-FMN oxidoreductase RutF
MLICIDKTSNTLPAIRHSGRYAVNYLSFDREEVARLFASKDPDKFDRVAWRPAGNGMPWLHESTLALAECTVTQEVDAGDHVVVIGQVDGGRRPEPGSRPLVYFRRGYRTV